MLLHTRIQNVGLVGVETRRTLPLSACRTMCQLQGCNCTPGSQALGLWASFDGEPFLCLNRETYLHRTGACGTMLHHLRTRASHLIYCTGTALVGPCCTICAREHATIRPRESVEPCCVEGASHTTEAHTITSTLETFLGGGTMLLHPLLSLVLLISYKDARITSNRESMNLLPEKKMKTF